MTRLHALLAASTVALGMSVPAYAQAPAYQAVPATAMTAATTMIVSETLWQCGTAGCTTARASARPAIVCAQAARKIGRLASFTAGGTAFDADALAKCNARAK